MPSIEKRTVSLPAEQASYIDFQVATGGYASASEVVRAGLRALQERDAAVERWLRNEVVPVYDALQSNPGRGRSGEQVAARLKTRHLKRLQKVDAMNDLTKERVLAAIDFVIAECKSSEEISPDVVIAKEITALEQCKGYVQETWPLPQKIKSLIYVGPVAAKNISDWNPHIAELLMGIDYVLKKDGALVEDIFQK